MQLTGGSHPSGGHLLSRGILLLNGDYLLKLGLEPHIGGNQSSWVGMVGPLLFFQLSLRSSSANVLNSLASACFLEFFVSMGWPANMVNSLVGARFLEIAVSSGLSAGNSLPSAPGSINELTNKKQSKGNHNRNENGKRIGCENRSMLRKKKIIGMKI